MLPILSLAIAAALAMPHPPVGTDVCSLLTNAEAAAVLGAPVAKPIAEPAGRDEDTGGLQSACRYVAGQRMLLVTLVQFSSAREAANKVTRKRLEEDLDEGTRIEDESGLGDRAWWTARSRAAAYLVLKSDKALGIVAGGAGLENSASLRPALRTALRQAMARL